MPNPQSIAQKQKKKEAVQADVPDAQRARAVADLEAARQRETAIIKASPAYQMAAAVNEAAQPSQQIMPATPQQVPQQFPEQSNQIADVLAAQQQGRQMQITQNQLQAAQALGTLTPEQQTLDVVQGEGAVGKVVTGGAAIGGGILGAKAGAATGALAGPIGAVAGGIIGGVVGAAAGAYSKITLQKRQNVKEAYAVFQQSSKNMQWIINQANAGKITPMQAHEMWDEELANFASAERNIKEDTSTNLKRFLSSGRDEAVKIEAFRRRLPELQNQIETAILFPDPKKVIPEQITAEDLTTE